MKNTTEGLLLFVTFGIVFEIIPSAVLFRYEQSANRLIAIALSLTWAFLM